MFDSRKLGLCSSSVGMHCIFYFLTFDDQKVGWLNRSAWFDAEKLAERATLHIETLILLTIILKNVSLLHDFYLWAQAAWVGHWLLGRIKEPWETNRGRNDSMYRAKISVDKHWPIFWVTDCKKLIEHSQVYMCLHNWVW